MLPRWRVSRDQRCWKPKSAAKPVFDASHLPGVALVIVTGEVEHAMENQDLQLGAERVTQAARVAGGHLAGDDDVTGEVAVEFRNGWEREHVGGLVLPAVTAVKGAEFAVVADDHVHVAWYASGPARERRKPCQRRLAYAFEFFANDHHRC